MLMLARCRCRCQGRQPQERGDGSSAASVVFCCAVVRCGGRLERTRLSKEGRIGRHLQRNKSHGSVARSG